MSLMRMVALKDSVLWSQKLTTQHIIYLSRGHYARTVALFGWIHLIPTLKYKLTATLLRGLSLLPYRFIAKTGEALGSALYLIPSKRRHILQTNIRLCFPEKSSTEREQ